MDREHSTQFSRSSSISSGDYATQQVNTIRAGDKLGGGQEGIIYRSEYDGTPIAYKRILKPYATSGILAIKEIVILSNLDHPNIVKLIGVLYGDSRYKVLGSVERRVDDEVAIALELATSNLDQYIKMYVIDEINMIHIMYQMLDAVRYVHSIGILHRDIKPDNFLVRNEYVNGLYPRIKLCDFGAC